MIYEHIENDIKDIILKVGSSFYLHEYYQEKLIFMEHWR